MWYGTKVKPVGTCALKVVNPRNNEKFKVRFLVVNESLTPLLGLNATEKMKLLTIHKENFVNVVENVNSDRIDKYPDVFDKSLGTLPQKYISNLILTLSLLSSQHGKYLCQFSRSLKRN